MGKWFIVAGIVLLVGCVGATALASGAAATADSSAWVPAMNAIVNAVGLVGGVITAIVGWFVRSMNERLKTLTTLLEVYIDWQREHYEATRANVTKLAVKQNSHEVACVGEHGPMPGRSPVPEVPMFEWPAPPQRRSTDRH